MGSSLLRYVGKMPPMPGKFQVEYMGKMPLSHINSIACQEQKARVPDSSGYGYENTVKVYRVIGDCAVDICYAWIQHVRLDSAA